MGDMRLRVGDRVQIRSPREILATLDDNGTLEGLPFMHEMIDWCGKTFSVQRRVEKTCVDGYPMRRFAANDVVILDGPRCDAGSHDGCKHGCRIFWKEAWLRPAHEAADATGSATDGLAELRARLKAKVDEQHYFCQSTELLKATEDFAGYKRMLTMRIALQELRNGDLGVVGFVRMLIPWMWQRLYRALGGDPNLHGPHKRTPSVSLGLRPGDRVRVKSKAEITATLDHRSRNRGMGLSPEMIRCCGHEAEVRYRVDRIIDERTGVMREIPDTVALLNMRPDAALCEECLCIGELGDCPRGEIMYWREIWLEKLSPGGAGGKPA